MARSRYLPLMTNVGLPESLARALAVVGDNLDQQKLVGREIEQVITGLHELAPERVSTIEPAIADQARLRRWRRDYPTLVRLFSPKFTDGDQLDRIPGLEFLFLFHRDGFLREAALNRISGALPSAFQFATIVWQLNDWVKPVQEAAMKCAARCFPDTAAKIIAKASFSLLPRQRSWGRWTVERGVLDKLLCRPDVAREMAILFQTETSGPVSTSLRYALRGDRLDTHLDHLARQALQPAVRALAAQCLIEGVATWHEGWEWKWVDKSRGLQRRVPISRSRSLITKADISSVIQAGVNDRSSVVRRAALQGLISRVDDVENASVAAIALLNDKSPSVRERAQFIMRRATADSDTR